MPSKPMTNTSKWIDQLNIPGPDARLCHCQGDAEAIRILKSAYVRLTANVRDNCTGDTLWRAQFYLMDRERYLATECRINECAVCGVCGEVHTPPACESLEGTHAE